MDLVGLMDILDYMAMVDSKGTNTMLDQVGLESNRSNGTNLAPIAPIGQHSD